MLDPLPTGEKEKRQALKCELCGLEWEDDENIDSIDEHGRCIDCFEEWGSGWPDR